MSSPLINMIARYFSALCIGVFVGVMFKAYFSRQLKIKIKGYQDDIAKSYYKIIELEEKNHQLEKRITKVDTSFIDNKIFMN